MDTKTLRQFLMSWHDKGTDEEYDNIMSWVKQKNETLRVSIKKNRLSDSDFWFYDEEAGEIHNKNNSFFQIRGMKQVLDNSQLVEQPILIQDEIGYLGIICKEFDGVLKFLIQAKIEPGNVNKIQLSPTIQATKSNFTQKHGGKKPAYLDYFLNAKPSQIIVDQIQSEQSSRFLGKRNRNIIIRVDDEVEVLPSHRFMTLGQIKRFMKTDNLVNMDTRTVLSCIPYSTSEITDGEREQFSQFFCDKSLFNSIFCPSDYSEFTEIYHYINDYKMLHARQTEIVALNALKSWDFSDEMIKHKESYPFKVVFCEIEIEGREVTHWTQPLFEANGIATFGLIMCEVDGVKKYLVHALPEAGCFDGIELAPSVMLEADCDKERYDSVSNFFFDAIEKKAQIKTDVILSEEGGRFYHEQNRNIILDVPYTDLPALPKGYFLTTYATLNHMVQYNNVLNIQLRNLLSLLEI